MSELKSPAAKFAKPKLLKRVISTLAPKTRREVSSMVCFFFFLISIKYFINIFQSKRRSSQRKSVSSSSNRVPTVMINNDASDSIVSYEAFQVPFTKTSILYKKFVPLLILFVFGCFFRVIISSRTPCRSSVIEPPHAIAASTTSSTTQIFQRNQTPRSLKLPSATKKIKNPISPSAKARTPSPGGKKLTTKNLPIII